MAKNIFLKEKKYLIFFNIKSNISYNNNCQMFYKKCIGIILFSHFSFLGIQKSI